MSEEHNIRPSDTEFDAFLDDSTEKAREAAEQSAITEEIGSEFRAVLAEHGYQPLDEDAARYEAIHEVMRLDVRLQAERKYGPAPDDSEIHKSFRTHADVLVRKLHGIETFLIDFTIEYGSLLESSRRYRDAAFVDGLLQQLAKDKRTVLANMVVKRRLTTENAALRAMITYLPGGNIDEDDPSMEPYFEKAIAELPEKSASDRAMAEARARALEIVGHDPSILDSFRPLTPVEIDVEKLMYHGKRLSGLLVAEREARLYELAHEACSSLTPQNVFDLIAFINSEHPVRPR